MVSVRVRVEGYSFVFCRECVNVSHVIIECCMQDTFARATHSAARPSARATIGYLVYKIECRVINHVTGHTTCVLTVF